MKKYRQTYIRSNLELRAKLLNAIRSFFQELHFLEVETPIRIPAPVPEANINAEESGKWYLHTSPEICMKQLVAAGYKKIFQLCRCFRKNERGAFHLPEMTLLEWYETYSNYKDMMTLCESLLKHIASKLNFGNKIHYQNLTIDLSGSWDRMSVSEAFERYASMDLEVALDSDQFEEVMSIEIEPKLGNTKPIFIYNYPASLGSLARLKPDNSSLAERFELYCAGIELCNAYTELIDPLEQRDRFRLEQEHRRRAGTEIYPMPEVFLNTIGDMPPAAGNAMGVDRLVMLFANVRKIDQVVAFIPEDLL